MVRIVATILFLLYPYAMIWYGWKKQSFNEKWQVLNHYYAPAIPLMMFQNISLKYLDAAQNFVIRLVVHDYVDEYAIERKAITSKAQRSTIVVHATMIWASHLLTWYVLFF